MDKITRVWKAENNRNGQRLCQGKRFEQIVLRKKCVKFYKCQFNGVERNQKIPPLKR